MHGFAVSTAGAILGRRGRLSRRQVGRRVSGGVPFRLLDESTWATPRCTTFMRMAITFEVRRSLAAAIRLGSCCAADAPAAHARLTAARAADDAPAQPSGAPAQPAAGP